jgi:hypothetical protein
MDDALDASSFAASQPLCNNLPCNAQAAGEQASRQVHGQMVDKTMATVYVEDVFNVDPATCWPLCNNLPCNAQTAGKQASNQVAGSRGLGSLKSCSPRIL